MNKLVFPVKIYFQFKENFEDFKKILLFIYSIKSKICSKIHIKWPLKDIWWVGQVLIE